MDTKELTTKVKELEQTITAMRYGLTQLQGLQNRDSNSRTLDKDAIDRRIISDLLAPSIQDALWDNISYTSSFASASITTTTTELLDANGRESDTSQGRRFKQTKLSKFKVPFYLNAGIPKSTVYITSPAISSTSAIGTSIIDVNKSFVGVKIAAGVVSLISSVAGTVTMIPTTITISTAATNLLEIDYYITHAVVKFNDAIIGDIACNLSTLTLDTFFPFLISIGSSDATSVNITTESYEFLQTKK